MTKQPCPNWRQTGVCCACKRPLPKTQWKREGRLMVSFVTVVVDRLTGTVGYSLLHHPGHRACVGLFNQGLRELRELAETADKVRWN